MNLSETNLTESTKDTEEIDPLEEMLNRTGCKEVHYSLQECMYEHRDWRKCQNLVENLRSCMVEYGLRQKQPQDEPSANTKVAN